MCLCGFCSHCFYSRLLRNTGESPRYSPRYRVLGPVPFRPASLVRWRQVRDAPGGLLPVVVQSDAARMDSPMTISASRPLRVRFSISIRASPSIAPHQASEFTMALVRTMSSRSQAFTSLHRLAKGAEMIHRVQVVAVGMVTADRRYPMLSLRFEARKENHHLKFGVGLHSFRSIC